MRKKSTQRIPTDLELEFNTKEELEQIKESEVFRAFVLNELYEAVDFALKNGKNEIVLFSILNSSNSLIIKKSQYFSVIDSLILLNQEKENYEECERLTKLKEKL